MTPRRRRRAGLAFVAPTALFLAAVIVFPLGHAFWTSLHRVRGLNATFVGLGNYAQCFGDEAFWHSLGVSFVFTASAASRCIMRIGLALALVAQRIARRRARRCGSCS